MSFIEGAVLVGVISFFLFLVAAGLIRLSRKIDAVLEKIDEPIVVNALAAPASDPMVHDFHSDNDQYASVTGRAQGAWDKHA